MIFFSNFFLFLFYSWRESFSRRPSRDRQILHHGKLSRTLRVHLGGLCHAHAEHGPLHLLRLCKCRRNGGTFCGTDSLHPPDGSHRRVRHRQCCRRISDVIFARDQRETDASNGDGERGHVDRRHLLEQPLLVLQAGPEIRIRKDMRGCVIVTPTTEVKRPLAFDIYYAWRTGNEEGNGNRGKQQIVARLVPARVAQRSFSTEVKVSGLSLGVRDNDNDNEHSNNNNNN